MKKAMQAKDTNRLNVLRGLLAQTLNASKTSNPINTDMQMLTLIKKTSAQSRTASGEFKAAGRNDLADKEDTQIRILEEYAAGVEVVGTEEISKVIEDVVSAMQNTGQKLALGDVLKRVFSPELLGNKPADRAEVARVVKQILGRST